MNTFALIGYSASQLIVAYLFLSVFDYKINSYVYALAMVIFIQVVFWLVFSLFCWANYFVFGKKLLLNLYLKKLTENNFPKIKYNNSEKIDPEEYLRLIYLNESFDCGLKLIACTLHTELSAVDRIQNFQFYFKLKSCLNFAIKEYLSIKSEGSWYKNTIVGLVEIPKKRIDASDGDI
jgi:hypothetical protein